MTDNTARYIFQGADLARAMGMPEHPRLAHLTLAVIIEANGSLTVGDACPVDGAAFNAETGAAIALTKAEEKMFAARGYAELEVATYSPALKAAIALEKAGLPAGRYDVNPTQVPAIAAEPLTYFGARSASFPVADGLMDPEEVAKAWEDVRAQIVLADPPFPAHMIGYTVSDPHMEERDGVEAGAFATLTVYA